MESYDYKMEVPVTVGFSQREDGSVSIDIISVPDEVGLHELVTANARKIKDEAEAICYEQTRRQSA